MSPCNNAMIFFVFLFFTSSFLWFADATCGSLNAEVFPVVPKGSYDMKYAEITEASKRPLGFKRYTIKYNDPSQNPCVAVKNLNQQMVEIKFQSIPKASLCFRDQLGDEICNAQGEYQSCSVYPAQDMYFEFYVKDGVEGDVNFWLRITTGSVEDAAMMWCDMRPNKLPGSLRDLPGGVLVPEQRQSEYRDGSASPRPVPGMLPGVLVALLILAKILI